MASTSDTALAHGELPRLVQEAVSNGCETGSQIKGYIERNNPPKIVHKDSILSHLAKYRARGVNYKQCGFNGETSEACWEIDHDRTNMYQYLDARILKSLIERPEARNGCTIKQAWELDPKPGEQWPDMWNGVCYALSKLVRDGKIKKAPDCHFYWCDNNIYRMKNGTTLILYYHQMGQSFYGQDICNCLGRDGTLLVDYSEVTLEDNSMLLRWDVASRMRRTWYKLDEKNYTVKFSNNPKKNHNICNIFDSRWHLDKAHEMFMYNLQNEAPHDIQHYTNALTTLLEKRLLLTSSYLVPFSQTVPRVQEMHDTFKSYIDNIHNKMLLRPNLPHIIVGDFNPRRLPNVFENFKSKMFADQWKMNDPIRGDKDLDFVFYRNCQVDVSVLPDIFKLNKTHDHLPLKLVVTITSDI